MMYATGDTGGSAFPSHGSMGEVAHDGMTLRDYFAARALVGLMGRAWDVEKLTGEEIMQRWAESAYMSADAMLKERAK